MPIFLIILHTGIEWHFTLKLLVEMEIIYMLASYQKANPSKVMVQGEGHKNSH